MSDLTQEAVDVDNKLRVAAERWDEEETAPQKHGCFRDALVLAVTNISTSPWCFDPTLSLCPLVLDLPAS